MIALQAEGLHTFYGKSHILHGVSLEVREGEIVALLGRNGAGKTTTLRSLIGLTPPREGKVEIFGQNTTYWPPYRIAALGVGYVPEGRRVFANLTVVENLRVPLARSGPSRRSWATWTTSSRSTTASATTAATASSSMSPPSCATSSAHPTAAFAGAATSS